MTWRLLAALVLALALSRCADSQGTTHPRQAAQGVTATGLLATPEAVLRQGEALLDLDVTDATLVLLWLQGTVALEAGETALVRLRQDDASGRLLAVARVTRPHEAVAGTQDLPLVVLTAVPVDPGEAWLTVVATGESPTGGSVALSNARLMGLVVR